MDQLEKLEEVHRNGMSKYNTDVKEKWNTMTVDYILYYKSVKCSRFNGRRFLLSIG